MPKQIQIRRRALLLLSAIFLFMVGPARAAEYLRFSLGPYEGWIEETGREQSIKVLPFIVAPGQGNFWRQEGVGNGWVSVPFGVQRPPAGLEIGADGRIRFGYKLISETKYLPNNIRTELATSLGRPASAFDNHTISFIPARYTSVTLEIGGATYGEDTFAASNVTGTKIGTFYIAPDNHTVLNRLRDGDFQFQAKMSYPLASFSSINMEISTSAVSRAWTRAIREIVRRKRSSGFSIGPISFGSTVRSSYVTERIESGSNSSIDSNVSIVMRDPTPEQEARVDAILGLAKITVEQAASLHAQAYAAALSANKLELADTHKIYAESLESEAPSSGDFTKLILEKLEKMKDEDALAFMAAGFKSTESQASNFYRYDGNSTLTVDTNTRSRFSEYIIRNTMIESVGLVHTDQPLRMGSELELAYQLQEERIFSVGMGVPVQPMVWARGVANAIDQHRLADIKFAFGPRYADTPVPIVSPNILLDANKQRLLHRAVQSGDRDIVEFLLRNGADPGRQNRFGDSPIDLARNAGSAGLVTLMQGYAGKRGTAVLKLRHPGIAIIGVQLYQPADPASLTRRVIDQNTTEIAISDYPMRALVSLGFIYRARVPLATLASFQFGYEIEQRNDKEAIIRALGSLMRDYKIPDGGSLTYEENIVYLGPQLGFGINPMAEW